MPKKRKVRTLIAPAKPVPPTAPVKEDWNKYIGRLPWSAVDKIVKMSPEDFYNKLNDCAHTITTYDGLFASARVEEIGVFELKILHRHLEYLRSLMSENKQPFYDVLAFSLKAAVFTAVRSEVFFFVEDSNPWFDFDPYDPDKTAIPAAVDFSDIRPFPKPAVEAAESVEIVVPARLSNAAMVHLLGA